VDRPPIYRHNCDACTYLGCFTDTYLGCFTDWSPTHQVIIAVYDLYFCNKGGARGVVIARFGSDGRDYRSTWFVGSEQMPEWAEAKRRAQERGLL
jgi:hypothetical protein